jgi:hypothetical protein
LNDCYTCIYSRHIEIDYEKRCTMNRLKYLLIALALLFSFSLVTTVPALAAPVVASVTETAFGTDTTSHYVNMPATVNAGDLLIVLFTNDGSTTVTTPDGWSLLASNARGTAVRLSVYYRIAAGTEGGTTVNFVTSASEQAAVQVYRITDWHGTTPPEISTAATGTSTAPNPAFLNPAAWDVADTLWLAVAGQDRGDQSGITAYPSSYEDGISTQSSVPAMTGVCRTHSARGVLAVASENPSAFTIPVSEEWVAFTIAVRPAPHDLTISSTEGGSVTTPGEGVFAYDEGTVVDLVAEAEEGYRFVEWTGDVGTIDDVYAAETTITMNGDYAITAEFVKQYGLTISSTEGGSVTEPGEGVFTYDEGTVVDLVATPGEGYRFVDWTGDVGTIADVYDASTTITMNGDYSISANFVKQYDLTISSTEGGSVTEPGEGVFTYDEGTLVDLVAEPEEGYRFDAWTGDVGTIADVYAAATTIAMNGDYSITPNFEEIPPPPVYPTATTQAATGVTTNSATMNMNYTVGDFSPVEVRFVYKKSADSAWSYTDWVSKSGSGPYAEPRTGLTFNTKYDFTAQLKYDDTVIEGTTLQFTTSTPPPWGGCFIATAAYGTSTAKQIDVLREFRDMVLLKNTIGSQFVALYYRFSPPVADFIAGNELLRTAVRELLIDPIVWVVETTGDMWRD